MTACLHARMSRFLVRLADVPAYWEWFPYLDFLRYGFAAQMMNHFGGDNNHPFQVLRMHRRPKSLALCHAALLSTWKILATLAIVESCDCLQGTTLLDFYGFQYTKWINLGFESLFLPAFFIVAILGLTFLKHSKR